MSWRDVAQRFDHRVLHTRVFQFEIHQQLFDPLSLQTEIATCRAAATDDGGSDSFALPSFILTDQTNSRMTTCSPSSDTSREHRLQGAGERRSAAGFDEVVRVMAKAIFVAPTCGHSMRTPRRSCAEHGVS
jgi:hypothetical protein